MSFVVVVVLGVTAFIALRGWLVFSDETYQLEDTRGWLSERLAQAIEGGIGGEPVRVGSVRMINSGESSRVTRFELRTRVGVGVKMTELMPGRVGAREPWVDALGVPERVALGGAEFALLSAVTPEFVAGLEAVTSPGLWTTVRTNEARELVFVWYDEAGVSREELEPKIGELVEAARGFVEEVQRAPAPEEVLRARARSRTEPLELRWRAARALLEQAPESAQSVRLLRELDELHAFVQGACVVWGGGRTSLSPRGCYAVLRGVEANAEPELADAAREFVVTVLPWTCLTDPKASNALRRSVAARALSSRDAPPPGSAKDAALVGVLCDPALPDLERGELFALFIGQGWAPNARSRREIAEGAGRWLREAMIKEVAARGVAFEDRDALLALRKGGVHDGLAPLLDALRRAGHLGAGQLTLSAEPDHRGALSPAGQRGELTPADTPAAGRGDMTELGDVRGDVVEVEE